MEIDLTSWVSAHLYQRLGVSEIKMEMELEMLAEAEKYHQHHSIPSF